MVRIKSELISCLRTFTRDDWKLIDGYRANVDAPTKAETDAEKVTLLKASRKQLIDYFAAHGVDIGLVTQDTLITKQILTNAWNKFKVTIDGKIFQGLVNESKFLNFISNMTLSYYNKDGTPKTDAAEQTALTLIYQELYKKIK